jgi:hypothetical protein
MVGWSAMKRNFERITHYLEINPVKAGLAPTPGVSLVQQRAD